MLCYGALAAYAFWLYAFGPALALLRAELNLSYAMVGVYSALWSGGALLAGATFAAAARRLSRAGLLWCSAAAASAGAGLFTAHAVAVTLLGAALLGFAGTTLLTSTQAILSDRHGERRERALIETNVGAAGCAVLAPLLLGLLQGTPAGWRVAMGFPVLLLAGLYLRYRHQPLPTAPAGPSASGWAQLPASCWLLASLVAVGIAVEFCVVYFGAELLTTIGLRTAAAATAMSGFYLGILASRIGGAWLIRRAGRTVVLLGAIAGRHGRRIRALLALRPARPGHRRAGCVCGLGVANLYPLSLALTLAAAPGNGDTANARTQLLGGALVIAAPVPARQPRRPRRTAGRLHHRAGAHRDIGAAAAGRAQSRPPQRCMT